MIPARIVMMERLPLTMSGKVDVRSLPPPREETAVACRPPADGSVVAEVIAVWRKSLRLQSIGPDDDFFELGGHSLLAATVASRLSTAFDIDLRVRSLFETPTAAGLAMTIAQLKASGTTPRQAPVVPRRPPMERRS
jgi:acyl carrier protein